MPRLPPAPASERTMRRRSSKKKRSRSACAPREPSPLPRDRAAPARCDLCMEVCSDLLQYLPVVHVYGSLKSPPGGLQRKYFTVVRTVPSSAHRMRHRLATHNRRFMASRRAYARRGDACFTNKKGGMEPKKCKKMQKAQRKKKKIEEESSNSANLSRKRQFSVVHRTDRHETDRQTRRTETFQPSELGYLIPTAHQNSSVPV